MTALSEGAKRLAALKEETGLSDEALGGLVGVSGVTWLKWRTGTTLPSTHHREALRILTTSECDGETIPGVGLFDWDPTGEELAVVARIKPLAVMLTECG